jgi:hypothetical protein
MSDRKAIGGTLRMRIETLAAAFALFEQDAMPDLSAEDRAEVRAVFYAGAQAILEIIDGIGADPVRRNGLARRLIEELARYAEEIKKMEESDGN